MGQPILDDTETEERILRGFEGAALVVARDGRILATNDKGESLAADLEMGSLPKVAELVDTAAVGQTIAVGLEHRASPSGEIPLETTVIPLDGGRRFLILARDRSAETNLRAALVDSRQRYKDFVEISNDFAWEIGRDGCFTFVSPRGALGYRADELVGCHPQTLTVNTTDFDILPFLSRTPLEEVELWMRRADSSLACVMLSCLPLQSFSGEWLGVRGICRDITRERERETALAHAWNREQLVNYLVRGIRDVVEPRDMLGSAAAQATRALGAEGCRVYRGDGEGNLVLAAQFGADPDLPELDDYLAGLGPDSGILEPALGDKVVLAAVTNYRKAVNGAICLWRPAHQGDWTADDRQLMLDVTNQLGIVNEQFIQHERIVTLSRTDDLTGVLNRRAFVELEIPRHVQRLERDGKTAALLYVDMDNFKAVNDVHGHLQGDQAILRLCDLLREYSRPGDTIARLGGDEFVLWMGGVDVETATRRAQELIEGSAVLRAYSGSDDKPLGISVGVAIYDPTAGESIDALLARADAAMYGSKNRGKGGFTLAPPAAGTEAGA